MPYISDVHTERVNECTARNAQNYPLVITNDKNIKIP